MRCIGTSGSERLSIASGIQVSDVDGRLRRLAGSGHVELLPGVFGGWHLTESGLRAAQVELEKELDRSGARQDVDATYRSFFGLNQAALQVFGDWQMRRVGSTHVVNDHTDAEYDASVLTRLMKLDDSVEVLCADLSALFDRFESYGSRFAAALHSAMAGDPSFVADRLDSYHSVWFQLHEDLLLTLGISREDERRSGR